MIAGIAFELINVITAYLNYTTHYIALPANDSISFSSLGVVFDTWLPTQFDDPMDISRLDGPTANMHDVRYRGPMVKVPNPVLTLLTL